jgi:hypothetical protein
MSRVALTETILLATNPASFGRGVAVYVFERGTEVEAAVYSTPGGGAATPQPLTTDKGGRPRTEDGAFGYLEPGSYDLLVGDELIPWEASEGGSLPVGAMEFKGAWNAATNTPVLADGEGSKGDVYRVTAAASRNLGSGAIDFQIGDDVIYDGSVWFKVDGTDAVASVAGRTGTVVLAAADVGGLGSAALLNAGAPGEAGKLLRADEQGAFHGRRLLRVLKEGTQDASIVVVGDSTSATYATWVGKVVDGIAARFPAYTVKYRDWTDGNTDYNAASEKQKGTGERTLTVYNCSVSGVNGHFQMGRFFDVMIASKQPDLIYLSHGHNHGGLAYTAEPFWRDSLNNITQTITRACPMSELVIFAQNPRTDVNAANHALRQFVTEQVAQMHGYGFLNVHRLFLDKDPAVTSLLADQIHPNATGYTLIAEEVLRRLTLTGHPGSQKPSSLMIPALNVLANGDLASFPAGSDLTNFTRTNVTLSEDKTNFESPNGYAVRMKTVEASKPSFLTQNVAGNTLRPLRGEWVTMLARVWIPAGQTGYPGRVNITENNGSHVGTTPSDNLARSTGEAHGVEGFKWTMCTRRIATDCTNISCIITCETNGFSGDVTIDRAILVRGVLPRDIR